LSDAQLTIDGGERPVTAMKLGPRQQAALDCVRAHQPASLEQIGAWIHAARGRHARDESCRWCPADARPVLRSLKRLGLVKQIRGQGYVTSDFVPSNEGGKQEEPANQIGVNGYDDWGGF
jgi:hypothetical protein